MKLGQNFLSFFRKLFIILSLSILSVQSVPLWECAQTNYKIDYPPQRFDDTLMNINSVLQEGGGLANIVMRYYDLTYAEFLNAVAESKHRRLLTSLKAGQKINTLITQDGCRFVELKVPLSNHLELRMFRENGRLITKIYQYPVEYREVFRTFEVIGSLFYDGSKAGISDKILSEMELILAGNFDFTRSLRKGDRFSVLYETVHSEGKFSHYGKINALQYIQKNGKIWQAMNYVSPTGKSYYLDEKGNNMLTNFIRNPVKFTRISSRYSLARKHPILNKIKAHRGVDFAAPKGTPVRATASGIVIKKTYSPSFGNVIFLKHGSRYTTVYAHLDRFAKIKKNGWVKRGNIIGYVGSTGLSTGPHLHYEFRVNGRHRDPLSVKLPVEKKLPKSELIYFQQQKDDTWDRFNQAVNKYNKNIYIKNSALTQAQKDE